MGTWGIGPFDNDIAADFADELDDASLPERGRLVDGALHRAALATDPLEDGDAVRAVAAAAIVVAHRPGGEPIRSAYGTSAPMPEFATDIRGLAVAALDRVVADGSELAELWDETVDGRRWRGTIARLRDALDPPTAPEQGLLFEL